MSASSSTASTPTASTPTASTSDRIVVAKRRPVRPSRVVKAVIIYALCAIGVFIAIGPFVWMLSTSFKLPQDIVTLQPTFIPNPFVLDNYEYLLNNGILPFLSFLGNSSYITILVVVGRLVFCSLAAYGFARLEFPGKNLAFGMLLAALMVPEMLMTLPLYGTYVQLGLIDTHFPLIVPPILANTFGVFLMRQFFMSVPKDYEEAALLDGAGHVRIFVSIMLPMAKPALATLAVLTFVNVWNDFFMPLIYLSDVNKFTLPVGLSFFQSQSGTEYGPLMAGATIAILPTVVLFVIAQRYFTQGIAMTGLKS
jgi:multiple sugar transport system permease protein